MRLVLTIGGTAVEFTSAADGGAFPHLLAVGTLRMAARAGVTSGFGVGESPGLEVLLGNNDRQTAGIIGYPLRAPASVYDGDDLFFAGIVSRIRFGRTILLKLES